ncbi:hypothetical protein K443DRAFT_539523 [Laccaria amethystina LaAM-08-1]|uniref:Uncharacterized protein n=1 Tax=Laccaria amethystina LaAM-08-1 TaxID=1095629 RepID=A0A0C9Y1Z9_9AGAR|nr:hypothetical protein K443DRAFT_539523 [Laccaria amethystina LaAM-08-1]
MARRKLKRNIAGLRNQPRPPPDSFPEPQEDLPSPTPPHKLSPFRNNPADGNDSDMSSDEENPLYKRVDSAKEYWQGLDDEELESDTEELLNDWEDDLQKEGLYVHLIKVAAACGDDPRDEDWVPKRKQAKERKARPLTYHKGPDVASKSQRTQRRYRKSIATQQSLDSFGFSCTPRPARFQSEAKVGSDIEMLDVKRENSPEIFNIASFPPPDIPIRQETPEAYALEFDVPIREESTTPPPLFFDDEQLGLTVLEKTPAIVQIREESITPPPITACKRSADEAGLEDGGDVGSEKDVEEMLEDEIEDVMQPRSEIRSWGDLREQIKTDLKKKHAHLPLSQINQLMILRNFTNLRMKGFGRIEASREIARQ